MNRFFVEDHQVNGNQAFIENEDVNHIQNVLRLKTGEKIIICNRQAKEYCCIINSIEDKKINLDIDYIIESNNELKTKIYLFQGLPKSDKMELIIQKAVELGAFQIIPVKMTRSVVKIKDNKVDKKIERWNKIALSAAKQSHRAVIPSVTKPLSMNEAISFMEKIDTIIVPYEEAKSIEQTREIIGKLKGSKSIGIMIGPEGGFDEEEIVELEKNNAKIITLGKRILRTETAGLTTLSILMYELEE